MTADSVLVDALRQTDLFGSLSNKALKKAATAAMVLRHKAGKQVTEQDKAGYRVPSAHRGHRVGSGR